MGFFVFGFIIIIVCLYVFFFNSISFVLFFLLVYMITWFLDLGLDVNGD